jgi:hypothetical protein
MVVALFVPSPMGAALSLTGEGSQQLSDVPAIVDISELT